MTPLAQHNQVISFSIEIVKILMMYLGPVIASTAFATLNSKFTIKSHRFLSSQSIGQILQLPLVDIGGMILIIPSFDLSNIEKFAFSRTSYLSGSSRLKSLATKFAIRFSYIHSSIIRILNLGFKI